MSSKILKIQNAIKIETPDGTVGRLDISGEVGWDWYGDAWDAGYFKMQMDNLEEVSLLEVHINSPGGSVIDGIAVYNYLVQHKAPVHVYIDGVAASIASVIAMAGDKIFMPSNTMMFIHEPWMYTAGNADELRKDADTLDTMKDALTSSYQRHFKGSNEDMEAIMKAETWMTAGEASAKFNNVTVMAQEAQIAATLDMSKLGDLPDEAKAFLTVEEEPEEEGKMSLGKKLINFLRGEGFPKAADALTEDIAGNKEHKEDTMTPEEIAAMKAEITQGVMAALKEAGVIKAKEEPKAKVEIAFEGDASDPDQVQAHLDMVKAKQLEAAVDWSDPVSIAKYQEAAFAKTEVKPSGSNIDTDLDEDVKAQNQKDTGKALADAMPAC